MNRTRVDEQGQQRRIDQIAFLKKQREELVVLENLKSDQAWSPLKGLIEKFIKSQERHASDCLDAEFSNEHYAEAKSANAVKKAMGYIIALIDNPGEQIKKIDEQVIKIQSEVKAAEEGQLI